MLFLDRRFVFEGKGALKHFIVPVDSVKFPAMAEHKHSAHHPLTGKIDRDVAVVAVTTLLFGFRRTRIKGVPREVVQVSRQSQHHEPRSHISCPAMLDETPDKLEFVDHVSSAGRSSCPL